MESPTSPSSSLQMSCHSSKLSRTPSCSYSDDSLQKDDDQQRPSTSSSNNSRRQSTTVIRVSSRLPSTSPVMIDVDRLEQLQAEQKKKRTVTFSDKPPEKHSAVPYEGEHDPPAKLSFRDRLFLLFRRLFVLFILISLVGFIVFLAVQSYENGKKQQNEIDR